MPREKDGYRDNLAMLNERFPDHDFLSMEETVLQPKGRHDPAIVHGARVVQDAATAIVLCDALALRFGTDWLK